MDVDSASCHFYGTQDMSLIECKVKRVSSEVATVNRLIYWIKKCMHRNNKFCKHFCVTCEFYELCSRDGDLS